MMKHATYLASACWLFLAAPALAQDASTVVAKVGETEITLGEMIITRAQLPQQYEQFPPDVLFQGILDQLIQQQLLADSVGELPARVALALANERRGLMAGEAINAINEEVVTPEAIQSAYDARFANVEAITELHAAHLLVETEEEAKAAKARLDAGEEFTVLAQELSTGPTGPNGGDLGWFTKGQMVPEFENVVFAMEVGTISDPFQTQFGWHIVTLLESREQPKPTLEELQPELAQQVREAAIESKLATLRETAIIEMPAEGAFDPALLTNLDLLEPAAE